MELLMILRASGYGSGATYFLTLEEQNRIEPRFDISGMRAVPEELPFHHPLPITSVERHGFPQVLCRLYFAFIVF